MKIHGIAYRQGGDDNEWLGENVEVPDEVPCTLSFNPDRVIGRAKLSRDDAGNVVANVAVAPEHEHLVEYEGHDGSPIHLFPVLSIGFTSPVSRRGGEISEGKLVEVALSINNTDTSIPPYTVTREPS